MTVALLVITDGRYDYLTQALDSLTDRLGAALPAVRVLVDDSGIPTTEAHAEGFTHRIAHPQRSGLAAAVRSGWEYLLTLPDISHVLHVEEDFTFTEVPLGLMCTLVDRHHLAQVCLQRQPCNPAEAAAGGIILADPATYTTLTTLRRNETIETHNRLFSLNPCVYPRWVMEVGWPEHGGEREFTDRLLSEYPEATFAYLGSRNDPPRCWHIGARRSPSWLL